MGDVVVEQTWVVKHFLYFNDITVGEVGVIVDADVAVTGAGESGETADVGGCVAGNVAETVAFAGDDGDGLRVVGIGGLGS